MNANSDDGEDVDSGASENSVKAGAVSWLTNLFHGSDKEKNERLIKKMSQALFHILRKEFQVHVPLTQLMYVSLPR